MSSRYETHPVCGTMNFQIALFDISHNCTKGTQYVMYIHKIYSNTFVFYIQIYSNTLYLFLTNIDWIGKTF